MISSDLRWRLACYSCIFAHAFVQVITENVENITDHLEPVHYNALHPHNVTLGNVSYRFLTVSWVPPADNVTEIASYNVHWFPIKNRLEIYEASMLANTTSYIIKGLDPGTRYGIAVVANDTTGKEYTSATANVLTKGFGSDNPCSCNLWGTDLTADPRCDPESGQCACKDKFTTGLACDRCHHGYYMHEKLGCEACGCPDKVSDGSCFILTGGMVSCTCIGDRAGIRCDLCGNGFYKAGEKCRPCDCNNNANLSTDAICDVTGGCLSCVNGTTGDHCELCLPGYIGSALAQNCTSTDPSARLSPHTATIVLVATFVVAVVLLVAGCVLFCRWRMRRKRPLALWTVELRGDSEDVNFSRMMEQPDFAHNDSALLSREEQKYFEKDKARLRFDSLGTTTAKA